MYRVIAIVGGGLMLAACSSSSSNFDFFKPAPVTDAVRFESEPPGADVKVGELTCRTPCSLAIPVSGEQTAVFTLNGYQAASETLQVVTANGPPTLQPNPVAVELTPAPPPPPATRRRAAPKKPAAAKPTSAKPAAAKPRAAAPAAPAATAPAAPAPAAPASPWPTAPAPRQ